MSLAIVEAVIVSTILFYNRFILGYAFSILCYRVYCIHDSIGVVDTDFWST